MYATLLGLSLVLSVHLGFAKTNFERLYQIAEQRYGGAGVQVVSEWQRLLDKLAGQPERKQIELVNDFFNQRVNFMDDIQVWKQSDYWATPLETMGVGRGDCEDFSIAKYTTLQLAGIPIEKLRMTYVKAQIGGRRSTVTQAHMVLSYYPEPGAEPLLLDNLIPDIKKASLRPDLKPVFGFNSAGLWVGGASNPAVNNPGARLSRWRDLLARMQDEGFE